MEKQGTRLAIVGGGAAGLAAAIAAGQCARKRGYELDIVIYESDDRVGRSILATGNGRCNFSNAHINVQEYHNAEFVRAVFDSLERTLGADYVHEFFASLGLAWREEADGRQFPLANKASVVVDVLRAALAEYGVRECCNSSVMAVEPPRGESGVYTLRLGDGRFERADVVIVTCGGHAIEALSESLEALGVRLFPARPMLGPLKVTSEYLPFTRELDNIRVKCAVTLARKKDLVFTRVMTEAGELMFRKYGVSGICVFNLSRFACPGDILRIDFLQAGSAEQAEQLLLHRREALAVHYDDGISYEIVLRGLLLPRVAEAVLKSVSIDPQAPFGAFDAAHLARLLSAFPLEVDEIADPDLCQVRRGGLPVESFDAATMQAHAASGFFAAGEALDVDGLCGGYNLHWAWSSGILAGTAAVENLTPSLRECRVLVQEEAHCD